MKAKTLLVAAVMFLGLSAAAFAQQNSTFSVGSSPVTAVTASGQTEAAGAITFSGLAGTPVTQAGTISISYGVPITTVISTANNLSSAIACGITVLANGAGSSNTTGLLTLNIPAGCVVAGATFTVQNVRVAVAGTSLTSLTASISTVNQAIVGGQAAVTVINSISAGIASLKVTTATVNSTNPATTTTVFKIKEGYLNAFNTTTYGGIGFPVWLRLTLTAAPPAGVTIAMPLTGTTDGTGSPQFQAIDPSTGAALAAGVSFTSASTAPFYAYYALASNSDPAKAETLTLTANVTIASSVTLPLPAAAINATVTLAPIGTAFDSSNGVIALTATTAPRFVATEVTGDKGVVTISTSNTTVLIPYASRISASGYDTGLAVANTTTDPGSTAMGFTTAVPQAAGITFYFYPQEVGITAGTPFSYTTLSTSPGTGLNASGQVPSGSSYTVLLSQLIAEVQKTTVVPNDFQGYIFIIAGFTNAHVQYFISDFKTFSNGGQGLVIGTARSTVPEVLVH